MTQKKDVNILQFSQQQHLAKKNISKLSEVIKNSHIVELNLDLEKYLPNSSDIYITESDCFLS